MGGAESISNIAVLGVGSSNPVGVWIVVGEVGGHIKVGAQVPVYVGGVLHDNGSDLAVVDTVGFGQGRHLEALLVRSAEGNGGEGTHTLMVARLHSHLIGGAVGQAGDGGAGTGDVAAPLVPALRTLLPVKDLVVGGVLGLAPADAQGAVGSLHQNVGGSAGNAGGQRHGGQDGGGSAAPVAVGGDDLEVVGGVVLQAGDDSTVGIGGGTLVQGALIGAVLHGVAGDVLHALPHQGDLAVARGGGQALHLGVRLGLLGHDVLEELDLGDGGKLGLVAGLALHLGNGDGDLFHGHLGTQVDGNHALAGVAADGVHSLGGGGIEGDLHGLDLVIFLILHQGGARLDGALRTGRGDGDLTHLGGLVQGNGDGELLGILGGCEGDGGLAVIEQVG